MTKRFHWTFAMLLALTLCGTIAAQEKPPAPPSEAPRGEADRQRALGTITSVGVDRFDVKKADGTSLTVLVNDQTIFREQQRELHLEDLKVGDHVGVGAKAGPDKQFVALRVVRLSDEQYQRFMANGGRMTGGPGGPGGPGQWGQGAGPRTGGEITAIDQNRITVHNPRQGERVIVVNPQTTFLKQGQAIALKDLKVGDRIFAMGKEQDGQFVATQIRTGRPGMGQGQRRGGPSPDQPEGAPPPGEPAGPPPADAPPPPQ